MTRLGPLPRNFWSRASRGVRARPPGGRWAATARPGSQAPRVRRIPAMSAAVRIPERVERRARWILDTVGGSDLQLGTDLPFRPEAWEAVERGELPQGDELAEAFFHL